MSTPEAEIERLKAQVAHLRGVIERAPHGDYCAQRRSYDAPCDCWKAALSRGTEP